MAPPKDKPSQQFTVGATIDRVSRLLQEAGCDAPQHDALCLVSQAVGALVHPPADSNRRLSKAAEGRLAEMVSRRVRREPLEYIIGRCDFHGITVTVDQRVLIPESSSEPLVDVAVDLPPKSRVHDVGTGSGAIALAIKAVRPDLVVTGSDISRDATDVARANATRLNLDVQFATVAGVPDARYDLVVANLPFQDQDAQTVPTTPEYTRYQPRVAVFAGPTGLEVIEAILCDLRPGTRIALKHAASQTDSLQVQLLDAASFAPDRDVMRYTIGSARER